MKPESDFIPQGGTADYVRQLMAVAFCFFSCSFCIYRSTPHLTGIYSCLFAVVDQGDGTGMCFVDVLKILMYVG